MAASNLVPVTAAGRLLLAKDEGRVMWADLSAI